MGEPYSKNNDAQPPVAFLLRQGDRDYLLGLKGHPTLIRFVIPTKAQVLNTCKKTSRKPPTIYIIFRNPVQKCLRDLNFKFERKDVSKISSSLWKRIDSDLKAIFEILYKETSEQWRKNRIIFEFFNPLVESPTNEETVQEPAVSEPAVPTTPILSKDEENALIGELFGFAHVPNYNKYLVLGSQ